MLQIFNSKQAKQSARALEKFFRRNDVSLGHGKALDAVALLGGYADWNAMAHALSEQVITAGLLPVERTHLAASADNDYGAECAIVMHTGFELRYSAQEEAPDYVRVCDPLGREVAYWVSDEWQEDPQLVMGAILGALARGKAKLRGPDDVCAHATGACPDQAPSLTTHCDAATLPFAQLSTVILDGEAFRVQHADLAMASLLCAPAGDPDEEDDVHHTVLNLWFEDNGLTCDHSMTLAELRALRWDEEQGHFVSPDGLTAQFLFEQPFRPAAAQRLATSPAPNGTSSGRQVSTAPARSNAPKGGDVARLMEVRAANADTGTTNAVWLCIAQSESDAITCARSGLGRDLQAPVVVSVDESGHGPYCVFVDDGFYAEVPYASEAFNVAGLMLEASTRGVTVETKQGIEVLKLKV